MWLLNSLIPIILYQSQQHIMQVLNIFNNTCTTYFTTTCSIRIGKNFSRFYIDTCINVSKLIRNLENKKSSVAWRSYVLSFTFPFRRISNKNKQFLICLHENYHSTSGHIALVDILEIFRQRQEHEKIA